MSCNIAMYCAFVAVIVSYDVIIRFVFMLKVLATTLVINLCLNVLMS